MPIFCTKAAQIIHLSVLMILGVLFTALPLSVFSLEISTPVGIQTIGQHLNLKSTLSNLPEGAESQLRSTCLKARINPSESISNSNENAALREVLVNFDPTIRRGGLLEFKSFAPVNDAVIEMELVSECPLVVFTTKWTLIMKHGGTEQSRSVSAGPINVASTFDPRGSSLLAKSRKPPPPVAQSKPDWLKEDRPKEEPPLKTEEETVQTALPVIEDKEVIPDEAVKVASVDTDLYNAGLIESRRQANDLSGGLGFDKFAGETEDVSAMAEILLPVALGASFLLLISLFLYRRYSNKKTVSGPRIKEPSFANTNDPNTPSQNLDSISREHVMAFSADPMTTSIGSQRVLESLIGNDEQNFDAVLSAPAHVMDSSATDPAHRSSLKISLELINRADIPGWKLPASYASLVESRNKSLELHRTLDALLLRSQIGLIELAFQDAKQGQSTPTDSSLDLLDQVLGEQLYELESKPAMGVPDIIKSHVRAKMCEIAGAEKRQLLRENLMNLNKQVANPALCFHSNAWREFLSNEGTLE